MFIILPYRDDRIAEDRPWATYAIIAINVFLYLAFTAPKGGMEYMRFLDSVAFIPADFKIHTLLTHQFFHADIFHLGGNMLFLYIFGANIETLMRRHKFVGFYLLSGLFACMLQGVVSLGSTIPMIGASGAIAGVMGAYLYVLPKNRVSIFFGIFVFFIFRFSTFRIRSFWVIGLWFAEQLIYFTLSSNVGSQGGVAFAAHIGGFVAGLGMALAMVQTKLMHKNIYDMLIHERDRHAEAEPTTPETEPWYASGRRTVGVNYRTVEEPSAQAPVEDPFFKDHKQVNRMKETSNAVHELLETGKTGEAAAEYEKALAQYGEEAVEPEDEARIGEIYLRIGNFEEALKPLKSAARRMKPSARRGHIKYMIGVTLSRHMASPDEARPFLEGAMQEDNELIRINEAARELQEIRRRLGETGGSVN